MLQHCFLFCFLFCVVLSNTTSAFEGEQEHPTINTVAGTGIPQNNGHQGKPLDLNIGDPFGVEVGPDQALYITEVRHHRIWRLNRQTSTLAVIVGNGTAGYSGDGGAATAAQLNEPYEIRFDTAGNMFFVEMMNHIVRRVDAKSGVISTIAGTGKRGFSGDGGLATEATFNRPHSIAIDEKNSLYIADIGNHRIRRVDLTTGNVETVAGNAQQKLPEDGQRARGNSILGPRALFIAETTMWIALREGHSVWRMDLVTGILHHVAGTGVPGFSGDGGKAKKATFHGPKGIALGPAGNVFVVDTENHAVRKIDKHHTNISTVAGSGPQHGGGKGDGSSATAAELNRPHGICVDRNGTIYIGDTLNHRIRVVEYRHKEN